MVFIEYSIVAHATEDENKVLQALTNLLPKEYRTTKIEKQIVEGHYGNRILVFKITLKGKKAIEAIKYLGNLMRKEDKTIILHTLNERTNRRGKIFMRFGKQEAYKGLITLADGDDTIKVVVSLERKRNTPIEDALKKLGILP